MSGPALIQQAEIRTLIPHAGTMCLLAGVLSRDDRSIVCIAASHRDAANPLRREGRLPALASFEYAGQAMAVHGALLAREQGRQARPAFLAAIRDARLYAAYLDELVSPLEISAEWLLGDWNNAVYQCRVRADESLLARGRITIMTPDY